MKGFLRVCFAVLTLVLLLAAAIESAQNNTALAEAPGEPRCSHSYGWINIAEDKYKASDATCVSPAKYYPGCAGCGERFEWLDPFEDGDADPDNHANPVYSEKTSTSHRITCSACNKLDEVQPHVFDQTITTADYLCSKANCMMPAVYYYSCVCGMKGTKTFEYGERNPDNHVCFEGCEAYDPEEDAEGVSEKFLKSAQTCTKAAVYYKNCVCGTSSKDTQWEDTFTYLYRAGHDYTKSEWEFDEDPDYHYMYCCREDCDDLEGSKKRQEHTFGRGVVTKMPDCWDAGEVKYTCTVCGGSYTEPLLKLGHWYESYEVKSTCTGAGYTARKCVRCGLIIGKQPVDPAGHKPGAWETVTKATCTEKGEEIQKCTVCDALLDSRETDALGHDWGEWTVVTPATTEAEGLEKRVCRNDESHAETRAIEKLQPTAVPSAEPTAEPTAAPSTEPTVKPTAVPSTDSNKTDVPKTGDSRNLGGAWLMMALAAAGLCVLAVTRREGHN